VRVNFNYFISEPVFSYVVAAVRVVARDGWRLLEDYHFEPVSGLWRHHRGPIEPALRLGQVSYGPDGEMRYPHHDDRATESELKRYLDEAATLLAGTHPRRGHDTAPSPGTVSEDFEHLRWFDLPPACLAGR
jgi:hypothetical protein